MKTYMLLILIASFNYHESAVKKETIDTMVDIVIGIAKKKLPDSLDLPDASWAVPIPMVKDVTVVKLLNGTVNGLHNINRVGRAQRTVPDAHGNYDAEVIVRYKNIQVDYEKFIVLGVPKVNSGRAVTDKEDVVIKINFFYKDKIGHIQTKTVDFIQFEDFKVTLSSNYTMTLKATDFILNQVGKVFNTLIKNAVKQKFTQHIEWALRTFQQKPGSGGSFTKK